MDTRPRIGSQWRKWDLHLHSPASILNNNFPRTASGPDWERYVSALEQTDLAVVGVTDYFTIDGYKRLREFQSQGRLSNIVLLPNVEFRLDQILTRNDGSEPRRLNFHVMFSQDLDPSLIEDHFLHDLDFWDQGQPQQAGNMLRVKPANLEMLGRRLQEQSPDNQWGSALEAGAVNAVVSLEKIIDRLTGDDRFKGKYLLALAETYLSGLPWGGQDHNIRTVLLQSADMVFSSNPQTREWCLGQGAYSGGPDGFMREFKTLKPCIHGSDAHDLQRIGRPCAKRGVAGHRCPGSDCDMRNCWIKADPTFEGLRQLLYEPSERVRCQAEDPSPVPSSFSVTNVTISESTINSELELARVDLPLNAQLIAITGGRGGGKTALVDLIANCYDDCVHSENRNSFVARIAGEGEEVETAIEFADGEQFTKQLHDGRFCSEAQLVYIAQGELERQVEDAEGLARQIEGVILHSAAVADSVKLFELRAAEEEVRESSIDLADDIAAVGKAELAADPEKRAALEKAIGKKQGDVKESDARAGSYRMKLTPARIAEAEKRQQALAGLRDKNHLLGQLENLLKQFSSGVQRAEGSLSLELAEINVLIGKLALGSSLPGVQYGGKATLTTLQQDVATARGQSAKDIEQQAGELTQLKGEEESLAKVLDLRKKAEVELAQLQDQLAEVGRSESRLANVRVVLEARFRSVLNAIEERRTKYREVIDAFGRDRGRILSDLDFQATVKFNEDELRAQAVELLDTRRVQLDALDEHPGVLDAYIQHAKRFCDGHTESIEALVAEAKRLAAELRGRLKPAKLKRGMELDRLLFANYFETQPTVTYQRKVLSKLSLGQKATVLMKIYLADGTQPIIIDSHDDHLDNEFIMDELVEGIRQAKQLRQVILVSNNGNVVVNSDAEQVIVAERDGVRIGYQAGSLENPVIREKLLSVLEGGEAAFSKRGQKYRL